MKCNVRMLLVIIFRACIHIITQILYVVVYSTCPHSDVLSRKKPVKSSAHSSAQKDRRWIRCPPSSHWWIHTTRIRDFSGLLDAFLEVNF